MAAYVCPYKNRHRNSEAAHSTDTEPTWHGPDAANGRMPVSAGRHPLAPAEGEQEGGQRAEKGVPMRPVGVVCGQSRAEDDVDVR